MLSALYDHLFIVRARSQTKSYVDRLTVWKVVIDFLTINVAHCQMTQVDVKLLHPSDTQPILATLDIWLTEAIYDAKSK